MPHTTILFLSANPQRTRSKFDKECADIQSSIKIAQLREPIELKQQWAVTPDILMQSLLDEQPELVHFAGHGCADGIWLQDEAGRAHLATTEALSSLFKVFNKTIRCVILNGCFTEPQAESISAHIPYVVGIKSRIKDSVATAFCSGFYKGIGAGFSVPDAFDLGLAAIKLKVTQGDDSLVLFTPRQSTGSGLIKTADAQSFFDHQVDELYAHFGQSDDDDGEQTLLVETMDIDTSEAKGVEPHCTSPKKRCAHFYIPFVKPELTGREKALENLHKTLTQHNTAIDGITALTGQGGIGKTQLAVAYAWQFGYQYDAVLWLSGHNADALLDSMAGYALDLGLEISSLEGDFKGHQARYCLSWLRQHPNSLLIVDNLVEPQLVFDELPGMAACSLVGLPCQLLVTTRLSAPRGFNAIPLPLLSTEAGVNLLQKEAGKGEAVDAQIAVRYLGLLPLAIKIAAGYIKYTGTTFADLIDILHHAGIEQVELETAPSFSPPDYHRPIRAILTQSLNYLAGHHGQSAVTLLHILALLPVNRIAPSYLLQEIFPVGDDASANPRYTAAVNLAQAYNLVEVLQTHDLRLHPIIHELLQVQIASKLAPELIDNTATLMRKTDFLVSLEHARVLQLTHDIPLICALGESGNSQMLFDVVRHIQLQFHSLQSGGSLPELLCFQAMKSKDHAWAKIWLNRFEQDNLRRLLLSWTTAQATPALRRVLVALSETIFSFSISERGDIISALYDGGHDSDYPFIRLWHPEGHDPFNPFADVESPFFASTLSGDGRELVTLETTGVARRWNVHTGVERQSMSLFEVDDFDQFDLCDCQLLTDRQGHICVLTDIGMSWLFDLYKGRILKTWSTQTQPEVALSRCGSTLLLGYENCLVRFDTDSLVVSKFEVGNVVDGVAVSHDGRFGMIRCGNRFHHYAISDVLTPLSSFDAGGFGRVTSFTTGERITDIVAGYNDGLLVQFSLDPTRAIGFVQDPGGRVVSCRVSDDVHWCVSKTDDDTLRLWDLSKIHPAETFRESAIINMMCGFVTTSHGESIATIDIGGTIHFWSSKNDQDGESLPYQSIKLDDETVTGWVSADGRTIALVGESGELHIYDVETATHQSRSLPKAQVAYQPNSTDQALVWLVDVLDPDEHGYTDSDFYNLTCQGDWIVVQIGPLEVFVLNVSTENFHIYSFAHLVVVLDISGCGQYLAVSTQANQVYRISLDGHFDEPQVFYSGGHLFLEGLSIAPGGQSVVAGGMGKSAYTLTVNESQFGCVDFQASVRPIEFSADGQHLLLLEGCDKVIISLLPIPSALVESDDRDKWISLNVGSVKVARMDRRSSSVASIGSEGSLYVFDVR